MKKKKLSINLQLKFNVAFIKASFYILWRTKNSNLPITKIKTGSTSNIKIHKKSVIGQDSITSTKRKKK